MEGKLKTLDLILFESPDWWRRWIMKLFTRNTWTHVGIVIHGKDLKELHSIFKTEMTHIDPNEYYIWESGIEYLKDIEDNVHKIGVQLTNLDFKLRKYTGQIAIKRFNMELTNELFERLQEIHAKSHSIKYDKNPFNWLSALLGKDYHGNSQHTDSFFVQHL